MHLGYNYHLVPIYILISPNFIGLSCITMVISVRSMSYPAMCSTVCFSIRRPGIILTHSNLMEFGYQIPEHQRLGLITFTGKRESESA